MNITPTPSVRAQILDIVRANPGINSGAVSKALPHVDIQAICANLATLTRKERLTRVKQANAWCYTAPADAPTEVDDDEPDSPPAPASNITTHVAQAPRRPGRITAAEAASRAETERDEADVETATPAADDRAADLGEPIAATSPADDDALWLTPTFPQVAIGADCELRLSINNRGDLSIMAPGLDLLLGPDQTAQLGEFLRVTAAIWSGT